MPHLGVSVLGDASLHLPTSVVAYDARLPRHCEMKRPASLEVNYTFGYSAH